MQMINTPVQFWCFCYKYSDDILSLLATGRFELQDISPYEVVLYYTPDISEYASFTLFQWCWYFDESNKSKKLCCWLGPAHHVGNNFCYYIIFDNAQHISRSSVIGMPKS